MHLQTERQQRQQGLLGGASCELWQCLDQLVHHHAEVTLQLFPPLLHKLGILQTDTDGVTELCVSAACNRFTSTAEFTGLCAKCAGSEDATVGVIPACQPLCFYRRTARERSRWCLIGPRTRDQLQVSRYQTPSALTRSFPRFTSSSPANISDGRHSETELRFSYFKPNLHYLHFLEDKNDFSKKD